ncbi:MAG: hypothetical protein ABWX92_00330 [Mycetocola sp.]
MPRDYDDTAQNDRRKKLIIGIAVSVLAVVTLFLVIAALLPV